MNILVTGACGLLGSHIITTLAHRHKISGVDRHPWWRGDSADIVQADLSDLNVLKDVIDRQQPDVIVHCAGSSDVDACEQNPANAYFGNVEISRRLVESASQ